MMHVLAESRFMTGSDVALLFFVGAVLAIAVPTFAFLLNGLFLQLATRWITGIRVTYGNALIVSSAVLLFGVPLALAAAVIGSLGPEDSPSRTIGIIAGTALAGWLGTVSLRMILRDAASAPPGLGKASLVVLVTVVLWLPIALPVVVWVLRRW